MVDEFSERYGELLTGSYDCVDRIVLNAYYPLGHNPGGFRVWWRRWHEESDEQLDNAHLMRLAGRFARRVRAWAEAHQVPVIDCKAEERKHRIAEEYLRDHTVGVGVFLILVARAPATVWKVSRTRAGVIRNLDKTRQFVNHYSFHIMDPTFGHMTIKMSGHPPFGAQVILNGPEYVAATAQSTGIDFTKEGNCFTRIDEPERLAQVADTLSQPGTIGRLSQVIDRWIYSACLCFGLDLDEQHRSGFGYAYSVYQVEYSRNLIFASGAVMERAFDSIVDRTRARLDVPRLRTLFGVGQRPRRKAGADLSPRQAVVIERPRWNLTLFKVHFGLLTLKGYTKASTCCASKRSCTTPKPCTPAGCSRSSPPSSPAWPAWSTGSPACSTASTSASCPTASSTSCQHPPRSAPPTPAASTQQAPHPRSAGRRARPGRLTRRVHRRRPRGQGPLTHRPKQGRLHRPASRLRPAQTPRQTPRRQTRPDPPLPRARAGRPHHRRPAHPA